MNKVLLKAAVVLNIAAASLVYVACSGDDGAKGDPGAAGADGVGCTAVASTTVDGFDIYCGTTLYGSIKNGTAVNQGAPGKDGTSCTTTPTATGALITCGDGTSVPIYNGTGGGGGPAGGCQADPVTTPDGLNVIQFDCGPNHNAAILICPRATGLFENSEGKAGFCNSEGTISRGGAALKCGGRLYDVKKHFCQRFIDVGAILTSSPATPVTPSNGNYGKFPSVITDKTTGVTTFGVGSYPTTYTALTDADAAYNKAELQAGVTSTLLPLCGVDTLGTADLSDAQVAARHIAVAGGTNPVTVYDALSHCARNIIIDSTGYLNPNDPAGGIRVGGKLDLDPSGPYSKAWRVIDAGQCFATSLSAAEGVDGVNFNATPVYVNYGINRTGSCALFSASETPYTQCPAAKPVLSIDDLACVDRAICTYNAVLDNSCYVKDNEATAGTPPLFTPTGTPGSLFEQKASKGTKLFTAPIINNKWSKFCVTLTRNLYYAANDPNLTSKAIADAVKGNDGVKDLSADVKALEGKNADGKVPSVPVCGRDAVIGPGNVVEVAAIEPAALADAFACLNGQLSYNIQGNRHDGTTYDKPIYCVTGTPTPTTCSKDDLDACKTKETCEAVGVGGTWNNTAIIAAPAVPGCVVSSGTEIDDTNCENITDVTGVSVTPATFTAAWTPGDKCVVSSGTEIDDTNCENITDVTGVSVTPATFTAAWDPDATPEVKAKPVGCYAD